MEYIASPFMEFFRHEASSGIILLFCAIAALIIANSPLAPHYYKILNTVIPGPESLHLNLSVAYWINDGLMAIFFFVIGLEVKRELLFGELKSFSATILPITAAIGGMIVPALIYSLFNFGLDSIGGWGIPMATDIAFALGILAVVASGAPRSIAIFLTALAIVDDLGAIVVIALFYNSNLSLLALAVGILALLAAVCLNYFKVRRFLPYLATGIVAWVAFLNSGIHPTIAGVALGLIIPADIKNFQSSLLYKLEHRLEPWSAYAIMPIFALANAGVALEGGFADLISPIGLGIIAGLCIGKPLGIVGFSYLLCKTGLVSIPKDITTPQFIGSGALGGIGFTMSLFIATLAFADETYLTIAKVSILAASVLSGLIGFVIFKFFKSRAAAQQ